MASSSPEAGRDGTGAGEARSYLPDSQLKPDSHASWRLLLRVGDAFDVIRLGSMCLSIQSSISSDSVELPPEKRRLRRWDTTMEGECRF